MSIRHRVWRSRGALAFVLAVSAGYSFLVSDNARSDSGSQTDCLEPFLSLYLVVSDDSSEWPTFGPKPKFTKCTKCVEMKFGVSGLEQVVRAAREPFLRIEAPQISESWVYVESDLYNPEKLYYQLLIFPNETLSKEISRFIDSNWNDRVVVRHCAKVTNVDWISPRWRRNVRAGVLESESAALDLAHRLKLRPKVVPYDRARDDASRLEYIRSILSEYAAYSNARERIAKDNPELHHFLQQHPEYWKLLGEDVDRLN